ncbi:MAG TPA: hypothetical protein VMI12_00950 [Puia sp.]|nr:hypothetical protein [Puia sp.]
MKYSTYIGIAAALILIIACFMPWAYYPDLDKNFNGFFSEKNSYGRPGKVFVFLAIAHVVLSVIPTVWAKRFNMFLGVLTVAYGVKTFFLFSGCYRGTCPDIKAGLYLVLISCSTLLIAAVLPSMKLKNK